MKIKELVGAIAEGILMSCMSKGESPFVTKWGTMISPLPKGAVLLEHSSDTFQWKRRWQQMLPNGAIIEYVETDDVFGYAKRSRIIKK